MEEDIGRNFTKQNSQKCLLHCLEIFECTLLYMYMYLHGNYWLVNVFFPQILAALEEDEFAKKNRLTYKLEQVRAAMESEVYC